jgi:altronate hydrolase
MASFLRLHPTDNVVVAVNGLSPGDIVDDVKIIRRIPPGHKAAVRAIKKDEPALKFGQIIGFASQDIAAGDWVHEHNIGFHAVDRDYQFEVDARDPAPLTGATFEGFRRANGRVGTRNYLGILTSVNCSATVARLIAREVEKRGLLDDFPEVDGVIPLVHGHGCGMDSKGEGYEVLKRTQWGYAANPNMGAVLMVGLGCETFQIGRWKQAYNIAESDTFRSLTIQDSGGTQKAIEAGIAAVRDLLPAANADPALGACVDLLVRHGGGAILSETPEIYGAEHLLTRRASPEVGKKLIERIRWWEDYTSRNAGSMNNNPSPGNKAGGLTTILEKSLGAAAKGGTTRLKAVVEYAEPVTAKGFVFMDTPGYDPVSATGQVAGGANILCFTTGRGSAYGCKPTPSIKLATNTPVYERMIDDMDINCGDVLDGVSIADKGKEIFEHILKIASGMRSKSEKLGYGDAEFVPWQIGATM